MSARAFDFAVHGSAEPLTLFDEQRDPPWLVAPETKLERRFALVHRRCPEIYAGLEQLALHAKRRGARHIGIKALCETLRYHSAVEMRGEPYKINNSYTALYARLLVHRHPELAALIELRERREQGAAA